jgi:NOL1/NOP2/sun family putative RNA methylase
LPGMETYFERYRDVVPEYESFAESLRHPLPTHLRVNRIKTEPSMLIGMLEEKGVRVLKAEVPHEDLLVAPDLPDPGKLLEYSLGYVHTQALTSSLASLALPVTPDSYVLDMCASPGGKTAHLAERMNNRGLIVANELHAKRHPPLAHTLSRLGVLNTVLTSYQAQEFPLRESFDFVMADVPCSGEGRLRFLAGRAVFLRKGGRRNLSAVQRRIILRGFDLLRPGGEMLYSTCTYDPEENESVVDFLLKERDGDLLPMDLGPGADPGILSWGKEQYDRRIQRSLRFYPHRVDSVGFFMARICKQR